MSRQKRVHEGLKIRPPPLCQGITNLPVLVDALTGELRADWRQTLIESFLESVDFFVVVMEVITRSESLVMGPLKFQSWVEHTV